MIDRGRYTLEALESDAWALAQPLDLWSYQRGDCWVVGDYGPFQLMAYGDSFEGARDAFCRALISNAEFAERRGEMYGDYMRRVNKCDAASRQNWQDVATDCTQEEEGTMGEMESLQAQKDAAYRERDMLIAALSKVFDAHLCRHPDNDKDWEPDWRWIVCVHLPTGQATWHIHDSELPMFTHLRRDENHWDGHSTDEKYSRLAALKPRCVQGE